MIATREAEPVERWRSMAAHMVWRGEPLPLTCAWCGRRDVYLSKTLRLSFAGESWIGEYWVCGWCGWQDVETLREWRVQ